MPVNSFDNYPMSWKPILNPEIKPLYKHLADVLKQDIISGLLTPGTKLPPQRELADYLDINLSTVSRAFKLCEQRGLICSAVGNGTYVASDAAVNSGILLNHADSRAIELGSILPNSEINRLVSDFLERMSSEPDFYKLLQYGSLDYDNLQLKAAEKWLSFFSMQAIHSSILFSNGGQNGIFSTLAALFHEGDRIATMPTTYPGIKTAAKILGIQLIPLHLENETITKEALLYAYKNENIRGLYLISDINNPTSEILTLNERKMIASFCDEYDIPVIEDAINTLFIPNPLPPVSSFTPTHGIFISSVSKSMSPGLRLAVMHVPAAYHQKIRECLYAMHITTPALMTQLFTRIILSGEFDEIRMLRIQDIIERSRLFDHCFKDMKVYGNLHSPIRWLFLPDSTTADEFEKLVFENGIQIYSASRFVVGTKDVPNAVRISTISAPLEQYKEAIQTICRLLHTT